MDIENPEVSFERYHDRYMATLRGQYEAGRMEGEARALRKLKEQSEAIQEMDRILAEKDREIQELKARIRELRESMKGNS